MTMQNADIVVENSSTIVKDIVQHLYKFTLTKLQSVANNPEDLNNIVDEVKSIFELHEQPFRGLTSQHMEKKYFKTEGSLKMPQEKVLGHRIEQQNRRISGITNQVSKCDTMAYVPLQAVLKKVLRATWCMGGYPAEQVHK